MAAVAPRRPETNRLFQQAIETAIREHGEVGLQVAVYHENELVVDAWGGIADETTGRKVDGDTLFPSFPSSRRSQPRRCISKLNVG